MKCCHSHTWIVGGGSGEWCYQCGAYRGLRSLGGNRLAARTNWVRPTGPDGKNPFEKLKELKR